MKYLSNIVVCITVVWLWAFADEAKAENSDDGKADASAVKTETEAAAPHAIHWRKDPSVPRRPASYIGGSLNYAQLHTWLAENDDHKKLKFGPLHSVANVLRVGDAFTEKFALGFQVQFLNAKGRNEQISAFALLLDASFYPWKGLGIRPSAGFGFGFAQGENKWEFGFGGPGTLAMSILYEFRITRKMTLAPVVTATWLSGDGYDGFFMLAGVEMMFWLANKKQYEK